MTLKKLDAAAYLEKELALSEAVKIEGEHLLIALPEGLVDDWYEISLDSLKSPEQIISWIFHLSAKSWVDRDILRKFIKVITNHRGITL